MFNSKNFIFISAFSLGLFVDWLIKNKYLGNKVLYYYLKFIELPFFIILFVLFILSLFIFTCLGALSVIDFDQSIFNNLFYFELSDDPLRRLDPTDKENLEMLKFDNNSNNEKANNTPEPNITSDSNSYKIENNLSLGENVNIHQPTLQVSMTADSLNKVAAAVSSTGGAAAAIRLAQKIQGPLPLKVGAGLGVMLGVQATTATMAKVLKDQNPDKTKFISDLLSNHDKIILEDKYPDFPLNLLSELNTLVNLEVFALIILFNVLIVDLLTKIDYNKYIPKNKFGNFLLFFIKRYIKMWGTSKRFLIICCLIIFILCVFTLKVGFYFIVNSN